MANPVGWDDRLKYQGKTGLLSYNREQEMSQGIPWDSHITLTCNQGWWQMMATLLGQVRQGLRMQMWVILTCPRALHQLQAGKRWGKGEGTGREKHSGLPEHQLCFYTQFKHSFIQQRLTECLPSTKHCLEQGAKWCECIVSHVWFLVTPMDCSLLGSSIHGIFQARILEWVAISYSRGSSRLRDQTHISCVSCIGR